MGLLFRPLAVTLLALGLGWAGTTARAQTTISIDGPTRVWNATTQKYEYPTWKPLLGVPGSGQTGSDGYMYDPINDQQTGQYDSDFVAAPGAPGFFVQYGLIDGVSHMAFRIVLNEYKTTGNLVNIRVGFDGNNDGKVDLFMGPSLQNNQYGLVFQAPGTGQNISPSTTTLGSAFYPTANRTGLPALNANNNGLAFNSSNFSNIELTAANIATYYPGWTMQNGKNPGDNDSIISFAIPVADINAAIAATGQNFTIDAYTFMRWIAFTATQNNSINQDVYGLPKITNSNGVGNTTWSSFIPLMNSNGSPIPEPSAYGALLGFGLTGLFVLRRRARVA